MRDFGSGPTLPRGLLDEVDSPKKNHSARRAHNHVPTNRKDRRKLEREQQKQSRRQHGSRGRQNAAVGAEDGESADDGPGSDDDVNIAPVRQARRAEESRDTPIVKKSKTEDLRYQKALKSSQAERTRSPPQPPRKTKERLAVDDAEIAALEKKLGIKGGKRPKALDEDGLGDLLGDLDEDEEMLGGKRKRAEDEKWLKDKRKRVAATAMEEESSEAPSEGDDAMFHSAEDDFEEPDEDGDPPSDGGNEKAFAEDTTSFDGFDSESSEKLDPQPKRERENPYIAPQTNHIEPSAKYIPPSLRGAPTSDAELQQRLRRQMQGQLNRLSEANLLSILAEVSNVYASNPRQYVTSTLIDLLLNLIADRTTLNDPFIILHASFITAVYKMHGQDFGAQLIEQTVSRFDAFYAASIAEPDSSSSKEVVNLTSLLAQLYNLQVIGSSLIFSLIRTFLSTLSETHTELLLRLVRSCGSQLRSDDPSALKDIVLLLQQTVSSSIEGTLSVRTKFMIESINDLKNNKVKAGAATSAMTAEHLMRMKKTLGTLNQRAGVKATEPLRFTIEDIRSADKKGKWWLVGASWKGRGDTSGTPRPSDTATADVHEGDDDAEDDIAASSVDLTALARQNNMITPLRRSIFLTLLTSADYIDAHTRLLKLNLTRAQEAEVPRVLLHCVGAEEAYNPYYGLVAGRLCAGDRKGRVGRVLEGCGRGLCRKLRGSEGSEDEEDDEDGGRGAEEVRLSAVVNQAMVFAGLIGDGYVGVGMLKSLALSHPKPRAAIFAEVLLVTLIRRVPLTASSPTRKDSTQAAVGRNSRHEYSSSADHRPDLQSIFAPALNNPEFAKYLRRFLNKVVSKTDLVETETERRRIKTGVEVLVSKECLGGVSASVGGMMGTRVDLD